jgi:hypothetical protein
MSSFTSRSGKTIFKMDILPPDQKSRRTGFRPRRAEVVDVHFVPVVGGPRRRSTSRFHNDNHRDVLKQAETQGFVAGVERKLGNLSADLFCAVVAAVFVLVFSLAGGFSFLFGQGAQAEAGPLLNITHVSMTPQDADGMRVLLINGIVENAGSATHAMPAIRAELMSGDALVASTLISPPASQIEGGHSRGFSARVPHPRGKLPDLKLSFAERDASRS